MAREYVVSGANQTVLNALVTLAFINPSATVGIEILRCWVSQTGTNTSAQQRIQVSTQVAAFPTLLSATPAKLKLGDPSSGIIGGVAGAAGTAGINATGEGAGAKTIILSDSFNNLNGWLWVPTARETIVLGAGAASGFGLVFPVAPGTLTGWQFGVVYAEQG